MHWLRSPAPNPRKIYRLLDLLPETRTYICCPKCFACYPEDTVERRCTFRTARQSPACGTPLFKTKYPDRPIRKYVHQDLSHWLARLLARPDMEAIMDARTRRVMDDPPTDMQDIWDGDVFRNFKDDDGSLFFVDGKEGRYAFSLNVDGFNPEGNRHGGRAASVEAIYMVCPNLPPSLRYKVENVYVAGLVP
ncbi:hypothetical protein SISNIDRAFT_416447, partial [Sistotremastrum niveocremeum HHB9708]